MTLTQLEAIYKANLGVGPLEALEAVYTQGYCAGAGTSVTAATTSVVAAQALADHDREVDQAGPAVSA